MGADTAKHYQWYPFHNFGHYELAQESGARIKPCSPVITGRALKKFGRKAKQMRFTAAFHLSGVPIT